jgi:hypothetical protein
VYIPGYNPTLPLIIVFTADVAVIVDAANTSYVDAVKYGYVCPVYVEFEIVITPDDTIVIVAGVGAVIVSMMGVNELSTLTASCVDNCCVSVDDDDDTDCVNVDASCVGVGVCDDGAVVVSCMMLKLIYNDDADNL